MGEAGGGEVLDQDLQLQDVLRVQELGAIRPGGEAAKRELARRLLLLEEARRMIREVRRLPDDAAVDIQAIVSENLGNAEYNDDELLQTEDYVIAAELTCYSADFDWMEDESVLIPYVRRWRETRR